MSSDEPEDRFAAPGALARALRRVPLFPLPDVVLFPYALMPLHIFEDRYRQMTRQLLEGDKLIVMGRRLEDEVAGGPPPAVATIAGVGEVVLAHELPDGRYNLVLRGRARVRIDAELPSDEPYRLVSATEIPDDLTARPGELEDADASLRALVTSFADTLPQGGELIKQVTAAQKTPPELVNVLAAALLSNTDDRQALLETPHVLSRLERLTRDVVEMIDRLSPKRPAN
jgi:Lon protease-like protein